MRLISLDGQQLGIVPFNEALRIASDAGVDLVEVASEANPPVCRIMDYRKLQYEQQRKLKESRKHQRQVEIKGVQLGPTISDHDYQTKLNQLRGFLLKGYKVRVKIEFKGAQVRRYELGVQLFDRLIADTKDIALLEPGSRTQRRTIIGLIVPNRENEAAVAKNRAKEGQTQATPDDKTPEQAEKPATDTKSS